MNKRPRSARGFTLVELLIVMAILAILMTLGISSFQTARVKARDAKRKSDISTITKSLEAFANDYARYPTSSNGLIVCNPSTGTTCDWNTTFTNGGSANTVYAAVLPIDSLSDRSYRYESATGNTYILYAALENNKDPAYEAGLGVNCGTVECNYRVKSSNNTTP